MKKFSAVASLFCLGCFELPPTYSTLGAPDGADGVVDQAILAWCEALEYAWCPKRVEGRGALQFVWALNFDELRNPKDAGDNTKRDFVLFDAFKWQQREDWVQVGIVAHEIGHICIRHHSSTGVMAKPVVVQYGEWFTIDAEAVDDFRRGCDF